MGFGGVFDVCGGVNFVVVVSDVCLYGGGRSRRVYLLHSLR